MAAVKTNTRTSGDKIDVQDRLLSVESNPTSNRAPHKEKSRPQAAPKKASSRLSREQLADHTPTRRPLSQVGSRISRSR